MYKVGLLVNPVAGMGGKVGLKGTDGLDVLEEARRRGAEPESPDKARKAVSKMEEIKDDLEFYVASGEMGEDIVKDFGFQYEVLHEYEGQSTQEDSYELLQKFKDIDLDLIMFAGGDGTARDVTKYNGLDVPVIGIPAGVKIHSGVYAISPEDAGELAVTFLTSDGDIPLREEEIIDIEEEAFRNDEIITKIYGFMNIPEDNSHIQAGKAISPQSDADAQVSAAAQFIDFMEEDTLYIIGSGSIPYSVLEQLGLEGTRLGVDLVKNKELVASDVYEQQILDHMEGEDQVILLVTPMGGQGYLFGRGNQQLSAKVLGQLDKDDIIIASTKGKIDDLDRRPFLVYTGDPEVDEKVSGYYKVITGSHQYNMYKVEPSYKG